MNRQLPYLVGNVVELLDVSPDEEVRPVAQRGSPTQPLLTPMCSPQAEEDGGHVDLDSQRKGKCAVIKTSTRQTIFLPVIGLVEPEELKPGDLVVRVWSCPRFVVRLSPVWLVFQTRSRLCPRALSLSPL